MIWEYAVAILSGALTILIIYLIPSVIQLRSTLERIGNLAAKAEERIDPLADQIEQLTGTLDELSGTVKREIDEVDKIVVEVDAFVRHMHGLSQQLSEPVGAIAKAGSAGIFSGFALIFKIVKELLTHKRHQR